MFPTPGAAAPFHFGQTSTQPGRGRGQPRGQGQGRGIRGGHVPGPGRDARMNLVQNNLNSCIGHASANPSSSSTHIFLVQTRTTPGTQASHSVLKWEATETHHENPAPSTKRRRAMDEEDGERPAPDISQISLQPPLHRAPDIVAAQSPDSIPKCRGLRLPFVKNSTPATDYPFAIHTLGENHTPWEWKIRCPGNTMFLIHSTCTGEDGGRGLIEDACDRCWSIVEHPTFRIVRSSIAGHLPPPDAPLEHYSFNGLLMKGREQNREMRLLDMRNAQLEDSMTRLARLAHDYAHH